MTTYICGMTAIASRTLEIALVIFLGCLQRREFESLESVTGIEQVMRRINFKNLRTQSTQGIHLLEVMDKLRLFEASDLRDKVYACIPVTTDASELPIDYSLPVVAVYTDFVRFQMSKYRNLDVVGFVTKSVPSKLPPGLPSWVSDWSAFSKMRPRPKLLTSQEHVGKHPVYHADCFCRSSNEFREISIRSNRLHLKGVFADRIRVIGEMGSTSVFDAGAEHSWAMLCGNDALYGPTREGWLKAYFRVLIADTCHKDGKITSRASEVEWPDELGPVNGLLEITKRTGTAGSQRSSNMKEITTKRRFAVTQAGYIGLVPSYAQVGDEIWVLVGGQVLYVLRDTDRKDKQTEKRIHEFLGEAYMHGLMDGEVGDLNRTVDDVILE